MYSQTVKLEEGFFNDNNFSQLLTQINQLGGKVEIEGVSERNYDKPQLKITFPEKEKLDHCLSIVSKQEKKEEVKLQKAPSDGVFPPNFYVTTNLETRIYYNQEWLDVENTEMDCGIVVEKGRAFCVPINNIKRGDRVVVGSQGVKTISRQIKKGDEEEFAFMTSSVSSEKSKGYLIAEIVDEMKKIKEKDGKIVVVGGPAIIHTGAGRYLARLIEGGYIDCLFAGNALATHDIESALYGTSLDCAVGNSKTPDEGHGFHLQGINQIRAVGSIEKAVRKGILTEGIMYSAVKNGVDYVLAGSIRDDGPLPDVITDTIKAQQLMREKVAGVDMVLMLATMLHSIATGNLLPAGVKTVCVDINTDTVTKLADRGSAQALGLVTDVELFLRSVSDQLVA